MDVAGILLTGGSSTRMGRDKATLRLTGGSETLAQRSGRLLRAIALPCVEVGPGHSGLRSVQEVPAGSGPLAALARGWTALAFAGPVGALVLSTDLPLLTTAALRWLAAYPGPGSVVPVVAGHPQPLCARWSGPDLDRVGSLVTEGQGALRALMAACDPLLISPGERGGPGVDCFADADTPGEASDQGLELW